MKTDKGPKGTFVLYDQLAELFPNAEIVINHGSPTSRFKYSYEDGQAYFIVAPTVDFMESEVEVIKRFVNNGNVLFISTYQLDQELADWLGVDLSHSFNYRDSTSIYDPVEDKWRSYPIGKAVNAFLVRIDSSADTKTIGKYGTKVNCIRRKMGSGYVILHTQPFMFSNYHLIKKKTKAYTEIVFSSVPHNINTIYWDEYSKGGSNSEMRPLKFLMSQPALKNAFLWALAGLILLVFFSFKRRQRVIPVTSPLVNNSLDMARTVSDMYYFGRRNEVMAKKKIAHWFEFLRTKYNIHTSLPPEIFWQSVKMRSGMAEESVTELRELVELFRNGDMQVSDVYLVRLNNLIDRFYKS